MIWRFFKREYNQTEIRILFISAFIALWMVFIITASLQGLSSDLKSRAKDLLGGSAILDSPAEIPVMVQEAALQHDLQVADNLEFFSMAHAHDAFLLIQVSAFSKPYPLTGKISIETQNNLIETLAPPPQGETWVSDRLLTELQIKLGDPVSVGNSTLKVTGVLKSFPLLLSRTNILSPLIYVNQADIVAMGVIQTGSQINYRLIVDGELNNVNQFLRMPEVTEAGFKIITTEKGQSSIERPFRIANRYLSVILVIQTMLSGVAIAVCSHIYAKRQQKSVAIMRALGASFWRILTLYLSVFLFVAFAALLCSLGLGVITLKIAMYFLNGFGIVIETIPLTAYALTAWVAFLLIIGFAMPPLLSLKQVSAIEIKQHVGKQPTLSYSWLYFFITGFITISLLTVFAEFQVPLRILSQMVLIGFFSFGTAWLLWKVFAYIKPRVGYTLKMSLQSLLRLKWLGYTQWVIYSLIFTFLLLIEIIQHDVLTKWQQQLPENTPNYFLINIQANQVQPLKDWFDSNAVKSASIYPVIRGAFTHVNGRAVSTWGEGRADPNAPRGMNRAINLTWMSVLPSDNHVIQGVDWSTVSPGSPVISIEENFANQRNLKLGDQLSFLIEGQAVTATVSQIRTLNWQSFRPNFFVIFPPGVLEPFPRSYISSFYLPGTDRPLINSLTDEFVELSVIDLDAMIDTMRTLVRQFSFALEIVLLVMLITGLLLMWVIIHALLKERMHEGALLKILGVPKGLLQKTVLIENALLGSCCGLAAALFAQMIVHDISYEYFDIYYAINMKWFLWGGGLGAILLVSFGWFGFRKVFKVSPLLILRQTE